MNGKPILCLDFDGVIHLYTSGWKGANIIPDGPVPGAMAFILAAVRHFRVAIFSSRSNQEGGINAMKFRVALWLKAHLLDSDVGDFAGKTNLQTLWELTLDAIEWPTEKPPAMITIDDRAITFTGVWPEIEALLNFKPWNKK